MDITISLEILNRNETYILTSCKEAMEFCDKINCDSVNILLDTYHMNIEEDDMIDAIKMAGSRLGHFHVGECNRKLPDMNNSLDWKSIGNALREINYSKAVVMEPFLLPDGDVGKSIRVWRELVDNNNEDSLTKYIEESLAFLRKSFRVSEK